MLYGLDKNGNRIIAEPNMKATCLQCSGDLISKCGSINTWHWAHKNVSDCDDWREGETEWHIE